MAKDYGEKKSFGKKISSIFKKAVAITLVGGAAAGVGGYYYGTVEEQEVQVTRIEEKLDSPGKRGGRDGYIHDYSYDWDNKSWLDDKKRDPDAKFKYTIYTTKGTYKNADVWAHAKGHKTTTDIESELQKGKIYRIKSYGLHITVPLIDAEILKPNILSIDPVTEDELRERAEAAKAKAAQEAQIKAEAAKARAEAAKAKAAEEARAKLAEGKQQEQLQDTTAPLSGRVVTLDLLPDAGGYSVQVTMPVEAAGKVKVNAVTPLVPTVKPVTPAPPAP